MNTNILCKWLELPPGPWPPDDRAILGLSGPFTALDVESRALAQMEKLRPHQLMQPDLVTEGMNRLAQALDNLTQEVIRAIPPTPKVEPELILDAGLLSREPKSKPSEPAVLEAEVVSMSKILEVEPVRRPPPRRKRKKRKKAQRAEAPARIPEAEPVPPGTVYLPKERRKGYAELVALRRVMRGWEKLQPYFAAPSEELQSPAVVFGFLEAVRDCRQVVAVDADADWFDDRGRLVLSLIQHPFCLPLFRSLVRSQRRDVATDWAYAMAHLRGLYLGLREEMQETIPRRPLQQTLRGFANGIAANPEWLMVALITLAIGIALLRTALAR